MIHPPENNEWQWKANDRSGLFLPWFTRPFLDHLEHDAGYLKGKRILEWGTGWGTMWLVKKATDLATNTGFVLSVDNDPEWTKRMRDECRSVLPDMEHVDLVTCSLEEYPTYPAEWLLRKGGQFDIIIIDGAERHRCALVARQLIRTDGVIILDNADEYPDIVEMFGHEERHCNPQPGHPTWRTDVFFYRGIPTPPTNTTQASHEQKVRRGMVKGS